MRVCPNCGYIDPFCWRQPYSRGYETQYARIDDLDEYQPEIAQRLKDAIPGKRGIRQFQDQYYAYGLWPSGYVRRRYIEIWKHHKWQPIPMEKHTDNADPYQQKLDDAEGSNK